MTKTRRLPIFLEVIFLALLALFYASHTLILSEFPKLYSTAIAPRLQTDALLQGKISLSPEPFGLPHNFIWAGENGMQQNWGMGVPFLRLPFEWLSGKCGLGPFPDRLILLFYLFLTLLVLSLALRTAVESLGMDAYGRIGIFIRFYLIIWVLFCPPMAGLAEKLRVYEETIFYGCLYAYVLLSLLMVYLIRPSSRLFI
ncbi:MAG: hypothetical protein KGJ11_05160, partial [Candidatus Omnitrophica bacterium]|nr:hypothetical protein [Candidatus Omnitrophota bacterium]